MRIPSPGLFRACRPLVVAAGLALGACAGPGALPTVDALRARVLKAPMDVEALRDLGARLALDGEYGPALGTLDRALRVEPGHGETLYLLGLVNEAMGRPEGAEDAYAQYLAVPATDVYRDSLRARLDGLVRARLQRQFATALATEDSVTSVPGTGAVGILPFAYRGENEAYAAIGRGLAEVLSVDLAGVEGLTVVERARLQALLAESELAASGRLDAATAPRAGRLLGADRLVGGEVDVQGESLRIESALWDREIREIETTEGGVADLFRVQRRLTLGVLGALGLDVPEETQARLSAPPTDDLMAFLLFSRALLQEDAGDYLAAAALYRQAAARDPGFALAAQRGAEAETLARAGGPAPPRLRALALGTLDAAPEAASSAVRRRADRLRATLGQHLRPGPETREPAVEGSAAGLLGPLPDPPDPPGRGSGGGQ